MIHIQFYGALAIDIYSTAGRRGIFLAKKRGTFYMLARAFPQIVFGENGNFTLD